MKRLAKWAYVLALTLDPRLDPASGLKAAEAERDYIWAGAVEALVSEDLRPDFKDGDDIVIRGRGTKADWTRLRAMVEAAKNRPPSGPQTGGPI